MMAELQTRLENPFLGFGGFPNVLHGLAEFHQERIANMRLPQMLVQPAIAVGEMPLMNEPALPHQHHMHHHLHHHHHLHQLAPQNPRPPPHQVQRRVGHNPRLPPCAQPPFPFYNPNLPPNPRPQRPAAHNPYLHPNHPINNNLRHYQHHPYDPDRRYKAKAVKAKKVPSSMILVFKCLNYKRLETTSLNIRASASNASNPPPESNSCMLQSKSPIWLKWEPAAKGRLEPPT
uniref:Uncharacterized protein n=1 Tax=Timema tahoe TaxID=61484 RepID=A0A7R9FGG9_9NEOP|nr:unnamed protein product [Timema tahoe]